MSGRNNRLIAMLLAFVMICTLAACTAGDSQSDNSSSTSASEDTSTAVTSSSGDTTASSASYFPVSDSETLSLFATSSPVFNQYYKTPEELKLYNWWEEQTGIDLDVNITSITAASEKVNLMIAGGDLTDIIFDFAMFYDNGTSAAIEEGLIYDLAPYLDEYMPDYSTILDKDESYRINSTTMNGEHPLVMMVKSTDSPSEYGAVIRQDWLDELGLQAPTTYDEWHDVLQSFNSKYGSTLWLPMTGTVQDDILSAGYGITSNINMNGPTFIEKDGQVSYTMTMDEMRDYVTMLHDWYNEGLIYKDFISSTEYKNPEVDVLNDANAGIWFCGEGQIDTYVNYGYKLSGLQAPSLNKGETTHLYSPSNTVKSGAAITTTCDNLESAMRMFNLLFTDEGITMYNYGTEDITYTLDDSGNPQFTDLILNNPDGWTLEVCLTYYCVYNQPGYCLYDRTKAGMSEESLSVIEAWGQNADDEYRQTVSDYMTTDEKTEYSNIYSDIDTYIQENFLKFIVGERSLDDWDDFVTQINSMDISRVVELAQLSADRGKEVLEGKKISD